MNNLQRVEVSDGFQDLPHHVAGIPLGVIALVQDPVKHFSACRAEGGEDMVVDTDGLRTLSP